MIRLFLVLLLLPSLAFAQKRGLVDRSGRVLVELPDSLDTPVLKSSVYGQLRVVRDLPDADYGKKRLDEDDQPVDLMSLIGLPDTVVVDKNQVNLNFLLKEVKAGAIPTLSLGSGMWNLLTLLRERMRFTIKGQQEETTIQTCVSLFVTRAEKQRV